MEQAPIKHRYNPYYRQSAALVIGINAYENASPLDFAVSDAEAFAECLRDDLRFDPDRIIGLSDSDATHTGILDAFHAFAEDAHEDDRLIVFFAGHGCTIEARRGEVGFLVPVDGDYERPASLIRMDELRERSDLLPQKHVFFILDACFSGLAFRRSLLRPGSKRFLQDMLQRYSRQAIAAGKGDEAVSDADGPLPEHSIFTGHLLRGMKGEAHKDGMLTANMLMAYTYSAVANDVHSFQTPHYGPMDGDGDMVLLGPELCFHEAGGEVPEDVMVEIGTSMLGSKTDTGPSNTLDQLKEYLSDTRFRIKLDEFINSSVRRTLSATENGAFSVDGKVEMEAFRDRLAKYEDIHDELLGMIALLGRWCNDEQRSHLGKIIARLCDPIIPKGGNSVWLALRWYPATLAMYVGGIAALAADSYENLAALLLQPVPKRQDRDDHCPLIVPVGEAILELERSNCFKRIPGHERHYVPRSEYLHRLLQPRLDDILFLGGSYDRLFDKLEILIALTYVDYDEMARTHGHVWGPIGRFGWKHSSRMGESSPLHDVRAEAERYGQEWGPIRAGLFQGKLEHFLEIWSQYEKLIAGLNWI